MPSLFTRIILGEIPCYKIAEDDSFFAFLDINPLAAGHTLCIPKKEIDHFFDQTDDQLQDMILFAKKVAKGIKSVVSCNRVGMTVMGLEIPHAHIHLIPINDLGDMNFSNPKKAFTKSEMQTLASSIAQAISRE